MRCPLSGAIGAGLFLLDGTADTGVNLICVTDAFPLKCWSAGILCGLGGVGAVIVGAVLSVGTDFRVSIEDVAPGLRS